MGQLHTPPDADGRPDGSPATLGTRRSVKRESSSDDDSQSSSADAWDAHRPLITSLYRDQNKRLKDVMFILEESHGFTATERMFKSRIRKWGLDKKMKARDVAEIFRQQRLRAAQGKSSVAYINGQLIEPERIRQYLHRASPNVADEIYRIATSDLDVARETPHRGSNVVICRTPSPPPRMLDDPSDLRIPHECLLILRTYVSSGFESGLWAIAPHHALWESNASPSWLGMLALAADFIKSGRTELGFRLIGIAFDSYKLHLKHLDTALLPVTILAAMSLSASSQELADIFIDYVTQLVSIILPPDHALAAFWQRLRRVRYAGLKQYGPVIIRAYMDGWCRYTRSQPFHATSSGRWMQAMLQWSQLLPYSYLAGPEADPPCGDTGSPSSIGHPSYGEAAATREIGRVLALPGSVVEADGTLDRIAAWLAARPAGAAPHARFDFLSARFQVLRRPGGGVGVGAVVTAGREFIAFCTEAYGPAHRRTARAVFLLEQFLEERGERAALGRLRAEFAGLWDALCDDLCSSVAGYVLDAERHGLDAEKHEAMAEKHRVDVEMDGLDAARHRLGSGAGGG